MRRIITILYLSLIAVLAAAQNVTLSFRDTPLPEALRQIDNAQSDYAINFIFEKLERYRVTKEIKDKSAPEAVAILCEDLPINVKTKRSDIYVNLLAGSVTVMSHVTNIFTKKPIPGARVELLTTDSLLLGTVERTSRVNQREGGFAFDIDSVGQYILHCSHPEYEDVYGSFEVKRFYKHQKYMLLLEIKMQRKQPQPLSDGYIAFEDSLDEVMVKATKVKFYLKNDTIIYNADAFNLPEDSMLEDLIRQLPGHTMDENGQIYVNGRKVDELLLNGKDFFNKDRQLILDNLPYFMVDKVKVYERFTDLQRMLGDTLTNKKYVMDIALKRKYQDGYIANAEGGYGTENRYLGRLFALRYTPNSRLSAFVNANKLSDNRKPGNKGNWSPLTQARSLATTQSAGLDYNVEDAAGRYIANGSLTFNHRTNQQETTTATEHFLSGGNTYSRGFRTGESHVTDLATGHKFEWRKHWGYRTSVAPSFSYRTFRNAYENATATLREDHFADYGKAWMDSIASPAVGAMLRKYAINRVLNNTEGEGHNWKTGLAADQIVSFPPTWTTIFCTSGRMSLSTMPAARISTTTRCKLLARRPPTSATATTATRIAVTRWR